MHVTKLCDVDFPSRYHNYIKISDLLTAVSLKNEICYAYWLREKLTPCMPCRNRMELPFQLCQRISCWNFTRTLKNILAYLQGWFGNPTDHPPATAGRPVSNACWESIAWGRYRSRIDVRRPSSRCVSDNESGPHADRSELPRGLRGGNSICSYKRA